MTEAIAVLEGWSDIGKRLFRAVLSVQVRKNWPRSMRRVSSHCGRPSQGKAHALIDRAIALVTACHIQRPWLLEEGWIDFAFEWSLIGLTLPARTERR